MGAGEVMKTGISEIVGAGSGAEGGRVKVYRALRQILCARCGAAISEGELFSRRPYQGQASGLRILPQCRECAPFKMQGDEGARSELLDALLTGTGESSSERVEPQKGAAVEAVEKRLGPALRRVRRKTK